MPECPKPGLVAVQGAVKAALNRVREGAVARGRQLVEEGLALQERMDSLSHSLTERTEENATLTIQVTAALQHRHAHSFSRATKSPNRELCP